ncbi:GNAT family N-acetyltransferase [Sansalvadorimonas sp. 2012CJ34-2]|uniref:GNAT family N-acetyltransferase n=1 Tax=Parendozoicomonas callyspongiae TaxID=2942213 RepID=A0ABT0PI20_9GAMM|nr:GNAT family N-acetyltransferase [Sansalvadorimonas sp. 2012CJ34-2]MCL6271004.1 GNAT family N-acetyltransferase [Sansalvadorimonas sp. 2012CJ34-2]
MQFDFTLSPDEKDVDALYDGLKAFNDQFCPDLKEQKPAWFVRDNNEEIIAGLYGMQYSNTLFIKYLWVSEAHRHQHLGSQLMNQVEAKAKEIGVTDLFLDTYSFQAPRFYENLGFENVGMYTGFPQKGVNRIFYQKSLQAQA